MAKNWHWRRIGTLAASLAVVAAMALLAPLVGYAWLDKQARDRDAPHPRPASQEDWRSIIEVLVTSGDFRGVPPPPPEPADTATNSSVERSVEKLPLVVETESFVLCAGDFGQGADAGSCSHISSLWEFSHVSEIDADVALKFRQELVLANWTSVAVPIPRSALAIAASAHELRAIFEGPGWWDDFYKKYPDSAGILRITRPVLSSDGDTALLYVEFSCGGMCATFDLLLMYRAPDGWRLQERITLGMA